jgi:hypothetical protein
VKPAATPVTAGTPVAIAASVAQAAPVAQSERRNGAVTASAPTETTRAAIPAAQTAANAAAANATPASAAAAGTTPASAPVANATAANAAAARAAAAAAKGAELSPTRLRQIYGQYVDAKRKANESTAALTFEKVAANLRQTEQSLREKHRGHSVDFEVVFKNGKPAIKPIVRG